MPSLSWVGKEKIVNHDKDVAFRLGGKEMIDSAFYVQCDYDEVMQNTAGNDSLKRLSSISKNEYNYYEKLVTKNKK